MSSDDEIAYTVIEPHFDAVRDAFAEHVPCDGESLVDVRRARLLVDGSARDSVRHFAACRDDGLLIVVAPEAADMSVDQLVALLCHELGHASDFLYPGKWEWRRGGAAVWLPDGTKKMGARRRAWAQRSVDQVEWAADSIATAVTGKEIQYCGPCMVQCFSGGGRRPAGLR